MKLSKENETVYICVENNNAHHGISLDIKEITFSNIFALLNWKVTDIVNDTPFIIISATIGFLITAIVGYFIGNK